jgi:hypothetical protein
MTPLKLEILRHGPPQNHLLSPLTEYLALCADQPASTVRVPFEHSELMDRLRALAYADGNREDRREARLRGLATELGDLLSQIPGLIAECSKVQRDGLLHLRLVLSANELALLPFELALAPTGFPGAGEHLTLQTVSPVCVTREVRRAPPDVRWPTRCKILFAAAAPEGVPPVPFDAHLLALLNALNDWMPHYGTRPPVEVTREHITVLPMATLRTITDACRTGEYTHVHILAHGAPFQHGDDRRFGIALHDDRYPAKMDLVDGERLSAALRAHTLDRARELARPTVVTLASCDSGNVGTVAGAGASIAHELHASGIPLVIASQFPLSIEGSVHMATTLYRALLRGDDPRLVLDDVRRRLRALVPDRHDWASVVAYASLPSDLEVQLRLTRRKQAERAIYAALSHLDAATRMMPRKKGSSSSGKQFTPEETAQSLIAADARVRDPLVVLLHLLEQRQNDTEILGLLASVKKRLGEVYYRGSVYSSVPDALRDQLRRWREVAEAHLREAERYYREVFAANHSEVWALVQALVLGLAIGREPMGEDLELAFRLCTHDQARYDDRGMWARQGLLELALIGRLCENWPPSLPMVSPFLDPNFWLQRMLGSGPNEGVLTSLRGQLERYRDFFIDKIVEESRNPQAPAEPNWQRKHNASEALFPIIDVLLAEIDDYEGRSPSPG